MLTIENKESHATDVTFEDLLKKSYVYPGKWIIDF